MSVAPAKPLSEIAAKLALKVDVFRPMCLATLDAALK
jgi:hypothetical protein